ncbi:MAG: hypothetical protein KGL39_52435 [Patescibacteria group bacterium]|nr:hypothetical protein [Patescibacteria group bacterium]
MSITIGDNGSNASLPYTSAGGTVAASVSAPVGQLVCAHLWLLNVSTWATPPITSNVCTGTLNVAAHIYDSANSRAVALLYGVTTSAGVPSITVGSLTALGSSVGGKAVIGWWNGFTGTPSLDSAAALTASGTGTTWSVPSIPVGNNPELLFGLLNCYGANASADAWSTIPYGSVANTELGYVVSASTPPTTETWSGTLNASVAWAAITAGFYNGSLAPTTHPNLMMLGVGS